MADKDFELAYKIHRVCKKQIVAENCRKKSSSSAVANKEIGWVYRTKIGRKVEENPSGNKSVMNKKEK